MIAAAAAPTVPGGRNCRLVSALQPPVGIDLVALLRQESAGRAFVTAGRLFSPAFTCTLVRQHEQTTYRGTEGLWTAWNDWLRMWRRYVVDSWEMVALGDQVLALGNATGVINDDRDADGRRRTSIREAVETRPATIWTLDAGRIVSAEFHESRRDALEIAGLVE